MILSNQVYELQAYGKAWTNIYWAGMNIQNLKESVVDISERNDLKSIRNVDISIEEFIKIEI